MATVEPSNYIEYNQEKLFDAIIYFCYHQLKHIDPNELPDIYIEIGTDESESIRDCGLTLVVAEDSIYVALSPKNIKENAEAGFHFKQSILKSLFHVFLHEFHHLLVLVDLYLKREKDTNLENIAECRYKESQKERRRLKRRGLDSDELWFNLDKEQDCEWFAFQNLALFENLYDHDFLYVPRKAFMAKVKKRSKLRVVK